MKEILANKDKLGLTVDGEDVNAVIKALKLSETDITDAGETFDAFIKKIDTNMTGGA